MIIQSQNVWLNEKLQPAQIEIEDGIIKNVFSYGKKKADIDYQEKWILPGFIDIHTHGYCGFDANKANKSGLDNWRKHYPKEGVTSFVATTGSQSEKDNITTLKVLSEYIEKQTNIGAEIMGINIEGNFISKECKGAQNKKYIVAPNVQQMEKYYQAGNGKILTVTYACERDNNYEFLKYLLSKNIVPSIGHSDCSYQQALDAFKMGAKGVTHTGNGMKPFHHRKPGLFGASCNSDCYSELICDGVHVSFGAMELVSRIKSKDKLILVTDSAFAKDDPKFNFLLGKDGGYRIGKTLFGSAVYVNKALNNLIYQAHIPLDKAINAVSINPATYLGFNDKKGSIEKGKDADLVVCDEEINLVQVYCKEVEQL